MDVNNSNFKNIDLKQRIADFEKSAKNIIISYGGDGTLLKTFHDNPTKAIIPVRDYGTCDMHSGLLDDILNGTAKCKVELRQTTGDLIDCDGKVAMSEVQLISADPTMCLRFDVCVNNKLFMDNVIANGIVVSTILGSTGYFKSVARTIFRNGYGLGFICPTYGINNLVLRPTDQVEIIMRRDCKAYICWDHIKETVDLHTKDVKAFHLSSDVVSLFGYEEFMCPLCRKGRNSTLVNDQYCV